LNARGGICGISGICFQVFHIKIFVFFLKWCKTNAANAANAAGWIDHLGARVWKIFARPPVSNTGCDSKGNANNSHLHLREPS